MAADPASPAGAGERCAADYQARISGPLLDRIDLQIEVPAVSAADLILPAPTEGSAQVRARVARARDVQRTRFAALGVQGHAHQRRVQRPHAGGDRDAPMRMAPRCCARRPMRCSLSARGFHRTLRVARTLADLDGEDGIGRVHVAEALSYRGETLRQRRAA